MNGNIIYSTKYYRNFLLRAVNRYYSHENYFFIRSDFEIPKNSSTRLCRIPKYLRGSETVSFAAQVDRGRAHPDTPRVHRRDRVASQNYFRSGKLNFRETSALLIVQSAIEDESLCPQCVAPFTSSVAIDNDSFMNRYITYILRSTLLFIFHFIRRRISGEQLFAATRTFRLQTSNVSPNAKEFLKMHKARGTRIHGYV